MLILNTLYLLLLYSTTSCYSTVTSGCPSQCQCKDTTVDCSERRIDAFSAKDVPADTTVLDLRGNNLIKIDKQMLQSLTNLKTLDLSNNTIISIEEGTFDDVVQLQVMHLNNNSLTKIESNIFKSLKQLISLTLNDNKINLIEDDGFDGMPSMVELILRENDLANIGARSFNNLKNLQGLDLKNNKLTEIRKDMFTNLTKLNILDLKNNRLKEIRKDMFTDLTKLNILFLQGNDIDFIEYGSFDNMKDLQSVQFGNLKNCTCNIAWQFERLTKRSVSLVPSSCLHQNSKMTSALLTENIVKTYCDAPYECGTLLTPQYVENKEGHQVLITWGVCGNPAPRVTCRINDSDINVTLNAQEISPHNFVYRAVIPENLQKCETKLLKCNAIGYGDAMTKFASLTNAFSSNTSRFIENVTYEKTNMSNCFIVSWDKNVETGLCKIIYQLILSSNNASSNTTRRVSTVNKTNYRICNTSTTSMQIITTIYDAHTGKEYATQQTHKVNVETEWRQLNISTRNETCNQRIEAIMRSKDHIIIALSTTVAVFGVVFMLIVILLVTGKVKITITKSKKQPTEKEPLESMKLKRRQKNNTRYKATSKINT